MNVECDDDNASLLDGVSRARNAYVLQVLQDKKVLSGDIRKGKHEGASEMRRVLIQQFLKDIVVGRQCARCKGISPSYRKDRFIKIFEKPLNSKEQAKMAAGQFKMRDALTLRPKNRRPVTNTLPDEGIADVSLDSASDDNGEPDEPADELDEYGNVVHKPYADKPVSSHIPQQRYISTQEVLERLRLLFTNEQDILQLIYSSRPQVRGAETTPDMFFIHALLVPPNKYRPEARTGDAQVTEAQQNSLYKSILGASFKVADIHREISQAAAGRRDILSLHEAWSDLQNAVNSLIDCTKNPVQGQNAKRIEDGIKQKLEKKEGLFRKNMMGKRVNFAARSVISPDPNIETNEIGVPPVFARKLTYPEPVTSHNFKELQQAVINGTDVWPGASAIENENGQVVNLRGKSLEDRMALANQLLAPSTNGGFSNMRGKKVYRHLSNGDVVLMNRQPTLHKPSIMGHRVRVLPGEKTIRMHYANCNTYNADFDDHISISVSLCSKDTFFHRGTYQDLIYSALRPESGHIMSDRIELSAEDAGLKVAAAYVSLKDQDPTDKDPELLRRLEDVMRDDSKQEGLDLLMNKISASVSSSVTKACLPAGLEKPFPHNHMQAMTISGAKGGNVNANLISCNLGQQVLEGRRVPLMVSGKSLPCFPEFDTSLRAGGYIVNRFLTGIRPQEYYFHHMAGREGLIDTAVKTSRSGYLQRCLIKGMEGLEVAYDSSVRDSDGSLIQFLYGEDGLDVTKQKYLTDFSFVLHNLQSEMADFKFSDPRTAELFEHKEEFSKQTKRMLKKAGSIPSFAEEPVNALVNPAKHAFAMSEKFFKSMSSDDDDDEGDNDATSAKQRENRNEAISYGPNDDDDDEIQMRMEREDTVDEDLPDDEGYVSNSRAPAVKTMGSKDVDSSSSSSSDDSDDEYESDRMEDVRDSTSNDASKAQLAADTPKILMLSVVEDAVRRSVVRQIAGVKSCTFVADETVKDMRTGLEAKVPVVHTEGTNIRAMQQYSDYFDPNQLATNDIVAMLEIYGVEACRNTIIRELSTVFVSHGIGVDNRHLNLIGDFMTRGGGFMPFNRYGLKGNVSPFTKMSFETTLAFLKDALVDGDWDGLVTPSSRIVMGRLGKTGTGAFDILTRVPMNHFDPMQGVN
ncbi:MAG: hypothetical protein STHCBS139747_006327 [Sporothrix thermara]